MDCHEGGKGHEGAFSQQGGESTWLFFLKKGTGTPLRDSGERVSSFELSSMGDPNDDKGADHRSWRRFLWR